jgi:hypothetical protein
MTTEQYRHRPDETPTQWPVLMICDYIPERSFVCANLRQFESLNGFDGWQPLALLPAAPTGSHASAGAEKGDGAAGYIVELQQGCWLCDGEGDPARTLVRENAAFYQTVADAQRMLEHARVYRPFGSAKVLHYEAPASPAVAEPATEGAAYTDNQAWDAYIKAHGIHPHPHTAWHAALAWERKQSTAREASLRAKLKEAEAKLAACEKDAAILAARVGKDHKIGGNIDLLQREIEQLEADKEQAVARERAEIIELWCKSFPEGVDMPRSAQGHEDSPDPSPCTAAFLRSLHQRLTQPANRSAEEIK